MVIAVEGMDGVGKTEIAKYISEKYGFTFIEKPLHYFYNDGPENKYNDLMCVANRMYDVEDKVLKSWYFTLGNLYATRMFASDDIVFDRHLVSNYYWNGNKESEAIYDLLIKYGSSPDLTILLYATPTVRMERLAKRDKNDPDLYDIDKYDDGKEKMLYFVEKFNLPYILIDTNDLCLEEVEEIVDEELKKLKGNTKKLVK